MDVTFAAAYSDTEDDCEAILLGPKFQEVKFQLAGAFHLHDFFQFSEDCRRLKSVVASSLSTNRERLDMFPWSLLEIPQLSNDTIELEKFELEGVELLVCNNNNNSLKEWKISSWIGSS